MPEEPFAPGIGDAVGPADLRDEHGATVGLPSLWAERPVALFFLRHLG